MARPRSPNRDKAYEIYIEHNGKITSKEIAKLLDEKLNNINSWRVQDKWSKRLNKVGAPFGNQNAVGNKGGGAPEANQNSRTYGWFSKYYPAKARNLIKEAEEAGGTPLEILWAQIQTQWIAIIRAQKIMYVDDHDDMTKTIKKESSGKAGESVEYDIQYAWDKYAAFLSSQSSAMGRLTSMLTKYDDMLHANWDTVTEEQKLRVERVRTNIEEIKNKKEYSEKKLELEKERFEHQKEIDSKRYW